MVILFSLISFKDIEYAPEIMATLIRNFRCIIEKLLFQNPPLAAFLLSFLFLFPTTPSLL